MKAVLQDPSAGAAGAWNSARAAAIIPARNEGRTIGDVLAAVCGIADLNEVIVVDDGSTDDTADRVEAARRHDPRIRCVRLPVNGGKGAAMFVGARAAEAPLLVFVDADLSGLAPGHVQALIEPVRAGAAEMTIGVFRAGQFNTDFSHWATPWLSGQRCLPAELFFQVSETHASGYGVETAVTLTARRQAWRVRHVVWRGVSHPPSEFHHGLWAGVRVRARMYLQILRAWRQERGWELLLPRRRPRVAAPAERWPRA